MVNSGDRSVIVERALILVEWLARNPSAHGVREISRKLRMSKSAVHRVLVTLDRRGWVRKTPDGLKYGLGLTPLCLGSEILNGITFLDVAAPIARELALATGEAIYLGVPDGNRVVIVHKVAGSHAIRFDENVGARAYLHTAAVGKAILAALDDKEINRVLNETGLPARTPATITDPARFRREIARIRAQGFAESDEENYVGALGIAAPIYDRSGAVEGAITVAGPKARMNPSRAKIAELVRNSAGRISAELGFRREEARSVAPLRAAAHRTRTVATIISD
jgi:IclR family acetate operon transcriptional repressor